MNKMDDSSFKYDSILKCVVIGDHGVGKTTIIRNACRDETIDKKYESTIGVDFDRITIKVPPLSKRIKFQIWDTAGQERFNAITTVYYRGSQCAIIVFDVTRRESFTNIEKWLNNLKTYMNEKDFDRNNLFIVGNKTDCTDRVVTRDEALEYAKSKGISYFELSGRNEDATTIYDNILIPLATNTTGTAKEKDKLKHHLEIGPSERVFIANGCVPRRGCCSS